MTTAKWELDFSKVTTIWTGDTYAIRNELKAAGATWSAANKSWTLPPVTRRENVPMGRLAMRSGVDVVDAAEITAVHA